MQNIPEKNTYISIPKLLRFKEGSVATSSVLLQGMSHNFLPMVDG